VEDALVAFSLVFLAELGDKSMLLAVGFAARYRIWPVLAGIAAASVFSVGLGVAVGTALGAAVPERAIALVGGLVFLGFGIWVLRGGDDDDARTELQGRSLFLGVTLAFFVAEIGDKTMIAAVALGGTQQALPTLVGGAAGMTAASGIAIVVASLLGHRLPERLVRIVSGVAFLGFGVWFLAESLLG
jgi:Ca2+/H+ antiporter, TMEM165/GDT1 family